MIITPGASGALQLLLGVLVNPGDKVLMADPGYPCNRYFVSLYGGEPVPRAVGPASGYQLTAEGVERHWQPGTVAVIVSSPSNPTGTLVEPAERGLPHLLCPLFTQNSNRSGDIYPDTGG